MYIKPTFIELIIYILNIKNKVLQNLIFLGENLKENLLFFLRVII